MPVEPSLKKAESTRLLAPSLYKLHALGMVQYERLIWLDTDVRLRRNLDDVFRLELQNGSIIYGQRDEFYCDGRLTSGGWNSGAMLFLPDRAMQCFLLHEFH